MLRCPGNDWLHVPLGLELEDSVTDVLLQGGLAQEKTLWKLQKQMIDYFLSLTKHKNHSESLYRMNLSARWSPNGAIF